MTHHKSRQLLSTYKSYKFHFDWSSVQLFLITDHIWLAFIGNWSENGHWLAVLHWATPHEQNTLFCRTRTDFHFTISALVPLLYCKQCNYLKTHAHTIPFLPLFVTLAQRLPWHHYTPSDLFTCLSLYLLFQHHNRKHLVLPKPSYLFFAFSMHFLHCQTMRQSCSFLLARTTSLHNSRAAWTTQLWFSLTFFKK